MQRLIEIRTYRIKPGEMDAFHHAVHTRSVPMLLQHGMDVVAYGRSDHEEASYFLVRAYANREAMEHEQASFYGSSAWKDGPRAAMVERIETYLVTVLWLSQEAIESMRALNTPQGASTVRVKDVL